MEHLNPEEVKYVAQAERERVIDLVFRYGVIMPNGILHIEPDVLRNIKKGESVCTAP